jgi:hypothetical protein
VLHFDTFVSTSRHWLDAREPFPDFVPVLLAEYAKKWYRAPTPLPYNM